MTDEGLKPIDKETYKKGKSKGPKGNPVFTVGELLPWKGWWFIISEINEKGILLTPKKKL